MFVPLRGRRKPRPALYDQAGGGHISTGTFLFLFSALLTTTVLDNGIVRAGYTTLSGNNPDSTLSFSFYIPFYYDEKHIYIQAFWFRQDTTWGMVAWWAVGRI